METYFGIATMAIVAVGAIVVVLWVYGDMSKPAYRIAFSAIGGGAVGVLSFWLILTVMDQFNVPDDMQYRPPWEWATFGGATFESKDGAEVSLRGPGYVYKDVQCHQAMCAVTFSVDVRQADVANIGLYLVDGNGQTILEPTITQASGTKGKRLAVRGKTPAETKRIRAFVYSPTKDSVVVFKDPFILVERERLE